MNLKPTQLKYAHTPPPRLEEKGNIDSGICLQVNASFPFSIFSGTLCLESLN